MRRILIGFLLVSLGALGAAAQTSTNDIVRSLTPPPPPPPPVGRTRSLIAPKVVTPQTRNATRAIEILGKGSVVTPAGDPSVPPGTPAVTVPPTPAGAPPAVVIVTKDTVEEFKKVKEALPKIDLRILFEYNSDRPTPVGMSELARLGEALQKLPPGVYGLVGHTDAIGSPEYNLTLSVRRAAAVRAILISQYGIPAERLTATGLGLSQLILGIDPRSEAHRRVEVVNMTTQ
jgi:OOP family OmpA-OmpF porin